MGMLWDLKYGKEYATRHGERDRVCDDAESSALSGDEETEWNTGGRRILLYPQHIKWI